MDGLQAIEGESVGAVAGDGGSRRTEYECAHAGRAGALRAPSPPEGLLRLLRGSLAALGLTLVASLLASAPALAAEQRGHVFSFSFPAAASGIAVDSATGDVYVAERAANRVEEFEPVLSGGRLTGEKYVGAVEVPVPVSIAVDNCTSGSTPCTEVADPSVGDVYVAGAKSVKKAEPRYVYKFNPKLEAVGAAPLKLKAAAEGVATDALGELFAREEGGKIVGYSDAVENLAVSSVLDGAKGTSQPPFAVDAAGEHFYVGALADREESGGDPTVQALLEELASNEVPLIAKLEGSTGSVLLHELDYEAATAVAVNLADVPGDEVDELGDVYVAERGAHVADEPLAGVAAFSPAEGQGGAAEGEGKLLQRFSAPGVTEGNAIAVDSANGAVFVGGEASGQVDVFELQPSGRPTLSGLSLSTKEGINTLSARVD